MQVYNHPVNLLSANFTSHKSHTHLHKWQFSFISVPIFKSRTLRCNLITTALLIYKITLYYTNPCIRKNKIVRSYSSDLLAKEVHSLLFHQ